MVDRIKKKKKIPYFVFAKGMSIINFFGTGINLWNECLYASEVDMSTSLLYGFMNFVYLYFVTDYKKKQNDSGLSGVLAFF